MSTTQTDDIVNKLLERPVPPLEPGKKVYDPQLTGRIAKLPEHAFTIAALHLANDDIHHAHLIAQSYEGDSTADLLHATLHRREGDYWNSKYWYSHINSHPLVPSPQAAKQFVDSCETVSKGRKSVDGSEENLKERQWKELKELVRWTRENCHHQR